MYFALLGVSLIGLYSWWNTFILGEVLDLDWLFPKFSVGGLANILSRLVSIRLKEVVDGPIFAIY